MGKGFLSQFPKNLTMHTNADHTHQMRLTKIQKDPSVFPQYEVKYSRMDQVKFVEDSL